MLPGTATAATRAQYGEPHLRRLRLIRALLEVGGLPVASIRRIIAALDDETVSLHVLFGTVQYALPPRVSPRPGDADWQAAEREVSALITGLGWQVEPDSPARGLLAGALVALGRLDQAPAGLSLRVYAEAVRRLARLEIDSVRLPAEPAGAGRRARPGWRTRAGRARRSRACAARAGRAYGCPGVRRGRHGPLRARDHRAAPPGPGGRVGAPLPARRGGLTARVCAARYPSARSATAGLSRRPAGRPAPARPGASGGSARSAPGWPGRGGARPCDGRFRSARREGA